MRLAVFVDQIFWRDGNVLYVDVTGTNDFGPRGASNGLLLACLVDGNPCNLGRGNNNTLPSVWASVDGIFLQPVAVEFNFHHTWCVPIKPSSSFQAIRFVSCATAPGCRVGLPVIPDDHRNPVSTRDECFREQRLLDLLAANAMMVVFPSKNREIFETDETYLHDCSLSDIPQIASGCSPICPVPVLQANLRRWRGLSMGMGRAGAMPSVANCRIFRHRGAPLP